MQASVEERVRPVPGGRCVIVCIDCWRVREEKCDCEMKAFESRVRQAKFVAMENQEVRFQLVGNNLVEVSEWEIN